MVWLNSLLTLPELVLGDLLSAVPDADGSRVSAKITASGESARISAHLGVSANEQGVESTVSATAEAESGGTKVEATGSAAASGETASSSVDVAVGFDKLGEKTVAVGSATAEAEAEAKEGGTAAVNAQTDADATGPDLMTSKDQESTETGGDHPIAESSTHLEAVRVDAMELETPELHLEVGAMDILPANIDWSS
jgi:hypothetical protein